MYAKHTQEIVNENVFMRSDGKLLKRRTSSSRVNPRDNASNPDLIRMLDENNMGNGFMAMSWRWWGDKMKFNHSTFHYVVSPSSSDMLFPVVKIIIKSYTSSNASMGSMPSMVHEPNQDNTGRRFIFPRKCIVSPEDMKVLRKLRHGSHSPR